MKFINEKNFSLALDSFHGARPFDHCLVEDFFLPDVAKELETEFIDFEDSDWFSYKNPIEDKKALNDWNRFPSLTYKVFQELLSKEFVCLLEKLLDEKVYVDNGLHGGGWHIHGVGGNLNPHLDYSIHPKMGKLRKLNIIVYMSSNLLSDHGGYLGLWSHNLLENSPDKLIKEIEPRFNRAVLFDTTQNSWHGISRPLIQPEGIYRKSLAVYYLVDPPSVVDGRQRALFAPREEQKGNQEILKLIKTRADSKDFYKAYKK